MIMTIMKQKQIMHERKAPYTVTIALVLNILLVVLFGGCTVKEKLVPLGENIMVLIELDKSRKQHVKESEKLVEYLNEGNNQAIYDLFSEAMKEYDGLNERIAAFVYWWQLIDVDTTSMQSHASDEESSDIKNNEVTYWSCGYETTNMVDKYDREIKLLSHEYIIVPHKEKIVGINYLKIVCDGLTMISIDRNDGYEMQEELVGTAYDRMVAVMDAIDETMLCAEYEKADKNGKKEIVLDVLNDLATAGTDELQCPLIREETIESEMLDSDILLSFRFIDGVEFQMVIR